MKALKRVLAGLLGMAQTRLELAGLELAQAGKHALKSLVWSLAMVLFLALASVFLCVLVILVCWNTHPLEAIFGCAVFYGLLACWAYRQAKVSVQRQGVFLEATLAELEKDRQAILDSVVEPAGSPHPSEQEEQRV